MTHVLKTGQSCLKLKLKLIFVFPAGLAGLRILGPYELLEGVSSPFRVPFEPNGKFYKMVPRVTP